MTYESTTDVMQRAKAALTRYCAATGAPMEEYLVEEDGEGAAAVRYAGSAKEGPMRLHECASSLEEAGLKVDFLGFPESREPFGGSTGGHRDTGGFRIPARDPHLRVQVIGQQTG